MATASQRTAWVTGCSGFLGRRLVSRLRSEGWQVRGVSRTSDPASPIPLLGWDSVLTGRAFADEVPAVVFHCAAFIPPRQEDSTFAAECFEANALLTLRLAEAVAAAGPVRFVHCSSGQIYGFHTRPVDEESPPDTIQRACFYLSSKLLAELYLERCRKHLNLSSVILRIGSLYGPGMPERSVVARFLATASQRLPLSLLNGGTEQFDFVTVGDVVSLLLAAAQSTAIGTFNAGSGQATTIRELADAVNTLTANPAGISPPVSDRCAATGGFAPLAMGKAIATFGLRPTPLLEGLRELLPSPSACVS